MNLNIISKVDRTRLCIDIYMFICVCVCLQLMKPDIRYSDLFPTSFVIFIIIIDNIFSCLKFDLQFIYLFPLFFKIYNIYLHKIHIYIPKCKKKSTQILISLHVLDGNIQARTVYF